MVDKDLRIGKDYFKSKGYQPFAFQTETWEAYLMGKSGLLNAPTGSGKTFALWIPILLEYIRDNPDDWQKPKKNGLQIIWVTPLRALAQDIQKAMQEVCLEIGLPWKVSVRNGDTDAKQKLSQKRNPPECLVTTPETLHILLSQKENQKLFENLKCIVVDEWHELMGNKRGVQVQLAVQYIKASCPLPLKLWGISATIGNLEQACEILVGKNAPSEIIRAKIKKNITMHTVYPDELEKYPWSGHLGIKLLDKIIPIIESRSSLLLFTNTRAQTEIWYQKILEKRPDWAGWVAMHHGSLDPAVRAWVENALHDGRLKVVVCTSSLDLGVDFRPVDAVIQIGSPKGVARFVQRAGRSGHRPGVPSEIYFVPTNSLELMEAAALRIAIQQEEMENIHCPENTYDVLIQFLITLAVGEGFIFDQILEVIRNTHSFQNISKENFDWVIAFVTHGGESLSGYDEFSKVEIEENGLYKVNNKKTAMRHRLSMGTIVSDPMLKVRFKTGGYLGMVEENFVSKLKSGDRFFFAGRNLEFIKIKEMSALVQLSKKKTVNVPRFMGGRISLTSKLAFKIREILEAASQNDFLTEEAEYIAPLLKLQERLSMVPGRTFLIEKNNSKEGFHLFFYPFEGRVVHEILGALVAYRISVSYPISFSIAMNDYGFELLSDIDIPIEEILEQDLFSEKNLTEDILTCINESEMAKRKFRDIATISGLVFQGFPGKPLKFKHLQSTSGILYGVFQEYDSTNLLLEQAHREVLDLQMEKDKILEAIRKINRQEIQVRFPGQFTPFSFPIMVDRLRATLSSETLEDRIVKMKAHLLE
ncbi:DEAD/DEAH box helicase [Rhodonellum psychrophilum GCM71 = DSM 17998]|uniref:DEAD/DEAH box helicase n=2 Tax=Rhodonellum TaxID=336827 RepID=U5BY46_9BACT|nr:MULTISPECIES: ligase-associated DNA damage response DEXH box helicase [Rhodonellum]ERM81561.1 DEAD/DEAH box helicase [Rhodonellum psychrophilum GCM71 = DSM 17998]SDZ54171.1 ATP-dependent helicase Lhr and Lhr-like helicase [Rhodonellum ikkaensis]